MIPERPVRLSAAMTELRRLRPYLTSQLFALIPVASEKVHTMAVDRYGRLYYNPSWITAITVPELAVVLYHEVWHLLRKHYLRLVNFSRAIANIAGDLEINDDIKAEGLQLPKGALYPENFGFPEHQTAEYYASRLLDEYDIEYIVQQDEGAPGSDGQSGEDSASTSPGDSTDESGGGSGSGSEGSEGKGSQSGSAQGNGRSKRITVVVSGFGGDCGSGATGQPAPWELPADDNTPHLTEAELENIRRQVAEDVVRYARSVKERGNLPGHWVRWAEEILTPPQIPWYVKLRSVVRGAIANVSGRINYTYSRPSRRQSVVNDVILPGMEEPIIRPAVIVDTSASVGDEELRLALSEVKGILDSTMGRVSTRVYSVDAQVQATGEVFTVREVRRILKGGGGTDMGAGIVQAMKETPRPDVIIVITDGYSSWPENRPGDIPVIVCLLPKGTDTCPKWARTVRMEK